MARSAAALAGSGEGGVAGATSSRAPSGRSPGLALLLLAGMAAFAALLFMTVHARGSWDFVLAYRGRKLWALVLVAYAVAISTVVFQTVTANRILTPAVMGFDALYLAVQTGLVFALGGFPYLTLPPEARFALDVAVMVSLSLLLFRWLFGDDARSLHLLVLAGIVFGVLFRSLAGLMQRLIDPNDFAVLQDATFASFNAVPATLLGAASVAMLGATLVLLPLLSRLDVLQLGRDAAIGLGVDHRRTVALVLVAVAVLVSVSTALVGPVLFFGLLVANLAYLAVPSYRHVHVLPAAVLIAVIALVGGQTVLEHLFGYDTALSIVIEFIGGITFLVLLLRGARR